MSRKSVPTNQSMIRSSVTGEIPIVTRKAAICHGAGEASRCEASRSKGLRRFNSR